MQREPRQSIGGSADPQLAAVDEVPAVENTRFSSAGAIPDVAPIGTAAPSASDRAFGGPTTLPPELARMIAQASPEDVAEVLQAHPELAESITATVKQVHGAAFAQQALTHTLHKPAVPDKAPPGAKPQQNTAVPTPIDMPKDPEHAKHFSRGMTAAWNQLAVGTTDERHSPDYIRLPQNIVKALDQAWKDSLSGKKEREQGGNLVRNSDGSYDVRRRANEDHRMFDQDDSDVGWRQSLVAQVHTHPYRDEKDQVPEQFATFSEGDFDSLMRSDAHMAVLRSGPYTFVLSKTKQFEKIVNALGSDEEKLSAFAQQMTAVYDKAFDATTGMFSEKCEAGVMAVCEKFHLVYYTGQGSDMTRKTKKPEK